MKLTQPKLLKFSYTNYSHMAAIAESGLEKNQYFIPTISCGSDKIKG